MENQGIEFRPPTAGELDWIVHRHGTAIAREFGWDSRFEATIAEILGQFGAHPGRDAGWIAVRDGQILGSIFVMPESESVARLRVLYVEPAARGLGLGKQLVELAVRATRAIARPCCGRTNSRNRRAKSTRLQGFA
jgi:GNAT superfamily N-acetyltransferase